MLEMEQPGIAVEPMVKLRRVMVETANDVIGIVIKSIDVAGSAFAI